MIPETVPERRYAILAEGSFASRHAKTAQDLTRYGRDEVAAVGEVFAGVLRPTPARAARLYEKIAALVKPAPVVAASGNTRGLGHAQAAAFVASVADATGLPAADSLRNSAAPILEVVLGAPKTGAAGR